MYVLSWRTVSALTRVLFWYLFLSLLRNSGNKHQNNPLMGAITFRHSSTYIILYIFIVTRHIQILIKPFFSFTNPKQYQITTAHKKEKRKLLAGSPCLVIVLNATEVWFITSSHWHSSHSQQLWDLHRLMATCLHCKLYTIWPMKYAFGLAVLGMVYYSLVTEKSSILLSRCQRDKP